MTGALSFIGMLLVIAGVERNPGPDKKFVFRYIYLLIEVGTHVLRRVFDYIVLPDFNAYFTNNPDRQREFNKLLSSRPKLTSKQLQLLPPVDNAPSSDKFDITLMAFLLRNVCGLCPSSDQVWSNPKSTDKRVEANITRLRDCRNDLVHSGSVYEDKKVLTTKWHDLCSILEGLSKYCSFGGLQAMIDKATSLELDDTKNETYKKIIKEWSLEDEKYVFSYLHLLIEEGTHMLRRVFDHIVGTDFKVYLNNNPDRQRHYDALLSSIYKPTPKQLQLLPPINNTPSSDNFDITLLLLLLRHVCSLGPSSDQVWSNLQPTDKGVEEFITGLRKCINDLMQSGSMYEDNTIFITKSVELCETLQGLNSWCARSDMQAMIDKATSLEMDDTKSETYKKIIKEWSLQVKKLLFRYQYLLIEVGTHMLRKVFVHIVGPNFKVYLDNNPSQKRDYYKLLSSRHKLFPEQLQLLPPINNAPSSEKFDITLLTLLLRNACGLCPSSDQVWMNPQPTDKGVEVYITRLRECRNDLVQSRNVYEDETVLTTKWDELCEILQGLSRYCSFGGLQAMIDEAKNLEMDETQYGTYKQSIQKWCLGDKNLVFRYQYLLIEVGTHMLRKVFVHIVGPNFKVYLDNNPSQKRDYYKLLSSRHKLIPEQLQLLPPINNAPSSEKFDITLLTLLLRNACGLCPSSDQVWMNPRSTDKGVEVYITRLRKCRKDLVQSRNVYEDETVLTTKWDELCEILEGLSKYCSFGGLQAMIDEAKNLELVNTQYGTYEQSIQEWLLEDIRNELIDAYENEFCSSLPLCLLLEDEKGGLLELYEVPTMYVANYHKVEKPQTDKSPDKHEKVKTCSDLFHVKDKDCKNIYLTGDAGVGKTSFCKLLSLLWCKSKSGKKLEKVGMQEYIDYLDKFEFVFYVNLRDTHFTDLKAIVVNQLFFSENKDRSYRMYDIVEDILGNHDSLVIMDGLDEWTPEPTDKRRYEIPVRPKSLKCVYLTTCRPYKIENVRLSETNLYHQVKMTGLGKIEIKAYVSNLINIINTKYNENKNYKEFIKAVEEVNLEDMLHIPMTTSHLVMLWFYRPLTSMSKSLIYGNIMDLLFKLAQKKGIDIQQSKPSILKLPDRLSELKHFKDHFSQIEQLCLLSFKLLFEHGTDITSLVFTRDQLASEPYCLSEEETNIFCTIGILSKNKVKRKFGKREHKLSFLHKSYLEFFAAIYVSTLDTSNVLELFRQCRTINDVLKYENFLIFYAGLSTDNLASLMTRIYSLISKDLDLTRELSIFSREDDTRDKMGQLLCLQDLILKCNIEGSYQVENSLPLEDFIFNILLTDTKSKYLRKLILSNSKNVRLLRSDIGEYFDEFDIIINLKGLYLDGDENIQSDKNCREFKKLIETHKSSLQIISFHGRLNASVLSLPLYDLHYLTSLSLRAITMSHEDIQYLTKFLPNNRQLKHVRLEHVRCTEHDLISYDVCGSFELVQCNKLVYLDIEDTSMVCTNINTFSLEYIELEPNSESIARSYINIVNSIQYALELTHLYIHGRDMLDDYLVDTLMSNVQYLSNIESIELSGIAIRDNVSFLLHPSVKQVSIILSAVNMTARWFQTFIESVIYKHCCIKLELASCIIRQDYGDTKGDMSREESVDYIHDYIKSISAIQIVEYDSSTLPHNIEFVINDYQ